ncbi:helix-turn-helix domain-containing protein [Sinanaerobacter chloroacetimidivorans]|uniref:Helix-turn-helix domain-containing protein n=1 Tax=Sinanaerobacter chloroacetimidivorans TaxID=2818044 RepID=A0A8J7W4N3_9FIRM|nr:helix-turn-helix domain-containing protein [Sinanaerobacter chloroacetimidivorans]MBR0599028.1 helix-turn-helix domain-containing protein [Sinanaerobacter chloroacetimidivorans]
MATIKITKELALALKDLRQEYKVASKDVATFINKSTSYISKLEKGDIKKISTDEFFRIFSYIVPEEQSHSRFDEFIGKCTLEFSKREIEQQEWLQNFDTVYRQIPIPPELIEHINALLVENNLSISEVVARVNLNEDLKDYTLDLSTYEKKVWHYPHNESPFIIMDISLNEIEDILSKKKTTTNYTTLQAFLYNLLKYKSEDFKSTFEETTNILTTYKFYSISKKNELLRKTHSQEEVEEILTDFDKLNEGYINQIQRRIESFSNLNIEYANGKLDILTKNLQADTPLVFGLFGIDLTPLKELDIDVKRSFIKDIDKLVKEYGTKIDEKKQELI